MKLRSLHIALIVAMALLSIGEAYHFHPDGGDRWQFVASPFTASSSATDAPSSDGHSSAHSSRFCLLHFWSSLLSTSSISLRVVLVPPARESHLSQRTVNTAAFWTKLPPSIRGPPTIPS